MQRTRVNEHSTIKLLAVLKPRVIMIELGRS